MSISEYIYEHVDDFGLISSSEAKDLGVTNQELVKQAHRGKLTRVAQGVYRMPVWPFQDAAPYAIAVKAAGVDAYLCGESVVALLNLAPTDPTSVWIASPHRVRRNLGEGVRLLDRQQPEKVVYYEGVPCQPVEHALKLAESSLGSSRVAQAAIQAVALGYLTQPAAEQFAQEV